MVNFKEIKSSSKTEKLVELTKVEKERIAGEKEREKRQ